MDDVIQEFVAEAREGIEALDCKLVTFEQHPDDPELLGDIFRLIHTIKGTSGFLGLGRLQAVAHAGENVLGAFRDGTLEVSADAVSAVLQAVDVVRLVIDGIASDGVEPPGDDRRLIERLDRIFEAEPQSQLAVAGPASTGSLLERLGGEATLDAACECVIGTLVRDEEIGPHLAGADLDTLQAALRGGLVAQARGTNLDGFAVALAQTFPRLSAAQGDRFTSAIRHALIALEADAAAVATLLPEPGEARDPAATPELAAAAF
ncbi:MAG: Hpt domain-containing protein, partial [Brevundimonas sp.]